MDDANRVSATLSTTLRRLGAELVSREFLRGAGRLTDDQMSTLVVASDSADKAADAFDRGDVAEAFRLADLACAELGSLQWLTDAEDALQAARDELEDLVFEATCQYCDRPSADGEDRACEQCAEDLRRAADYRRRYEVAL